jgi:hypothetical protein
MRELAHEHEKDPVVSGCGGEVLVESGVDVHVV